MLIQAALRLRALFSPAHHHEFVIGSAAGKIFFSEQTRNVGTHRLHQALAVPHAAVAIVDADGNHQAAEGLLAFHNSSSTGCWIIPAAGWREPDRGH